MFGFIFYGLVPFDTSWLRVIIKLLAGRSISDSILLSALLTCLPYFSLCHWYLGSGKEEVGCCIHSCLWTRQLLLGTDDFGPELISGGKVKVKGMFIIPGGSKNHACSLMASFLWESNSKLLLFSFASFSLRGSWWMGMGKFLASRMVKQREDTCLQHNPFCPVNSVQVLRESNKDME